MSKRFCFFLIVLTLAVVVAVFLLPIVGKTFEKPPSQIYWLRFNRTLLAVISGGGLALAGLVFQAMFRNPLATPYTLGVASGASFGAALCLQSGFHFALPFLQGTGVSLGAFAGALLAMAVVYALSRSRDASSERMLLAGVAVNFFFASMIVLLQYVSAPHDAMQMLRWTMGGVQNAMAPDNIKLGPIVIVAVLFLFFFSRELNVIVTGTERALSLGVNVERLRTTLFVLSSLLVGAIVSVTGPIGFVGLMIPHIARMLVGPDHGRLIPTTLLFGSVFLAACDTLGRTIFYPAELPVGIITSLLGGPFFLWLLLRSEKRLG